VRKYMSSMSGSGADFAMLGTQPMDV
jgi:hypothetical protein